MQKTSMVIALMGLCVAHQAAADQALVETLFLKCKMQKGSWTVTALDENTPNTPSDGCPFIDKGEILSVCKSGELNFKIVTKTDYKSPYYPVLIPSISILNMSEHPYYLSLDEVCYMKRNELQIPYPGAYCNEYIDKNEIYLLNEKQTPSYLYIELLGADRNYDTIKINRENASIERTVKIDSFKKMKFNKDGSQVYASGDIYMSISAKQIGVCEKSVDMENRPTKF